MLIKICNVLYRDTKTIIADPIADIVFKSTLAAFPFGSSGILV
jgi:hypothetical protein